MSSWPCPVGVLRFSPLSASPTPHPRFTCLGESLLVFSPLDAEGTTS